MTVLTAGNLYLAKFDDSKYESDNGFKGRGGNLRQQNYRALNCMLEVFDEDGSHICLIPWGIPVNHTATHNCPLMRFFRSIGIYRDPNEFNPKELEGMEVKITVNNICDSHWGLRTVVDQFFPKNCET